MAKILMVGGAGYVGGWMTDELVEAGHDVLVYDSLVYEDFYLKPVRLIHGDVLDRTSLLPHLKWADCVIWLAALVGNPACALDAKLTKRTNFEVVRSLVKDFRGRILFPSSCSVYGSQDDMLTEESSVEPLSLYAETKLAAETVLLNESADAVIFRLGTLFGLGDTYSRLRTDLVLNLLTIRAVIANRMTVFGGAQYRPLLHVRDVATAFVVSIDADHTGVYNLHSDNLMIIELAELIREHVPEASLVISEGSPEDARNYKVSSQKAMDTFSFKPEWNLGDGIREVATIVREGRIRDTSLARYSNYDRLRPLLSDDANPLGRRLANSRKVSGAS